MQASSVINNEIVDTGKEITCVNPSNTSEIVGKVKLASKETVDEAEKVAKEAQKVWSQTSGAEKTKLLYQAADKLEKKAEEIAALATKEMGKPIKEMKGEVQRAVQLFRYYAAEGVRPDGETIPASASGIHQYAKRVPLGVIGLITPWNFPVAIPIWKMAPALLCGNAVIWKPAENSYLTAAKVVEVLNEVGFPSGLINLVIGSGREVGNYLVEEADINAVSFTGSTNVGREIAKKAAARNIKYQTEMGGKNPAVVLEDADLDLAASAVLSGAFRSAGQKCTATSRVIVESSAYESFKASLLQAAKSVSVTSADDENCYLGPVVSEAQFHSVSEYINKAANDGDIVYQGTLPSEQGYYVKPTIVENLPEHHAAWDEEVFGPLIVLKKVNNIDEAIACANDTEYGLSASIFTQNLTKSFQFMEESQAGMVRVNLETAGVEYQAPFGGMKESSSHSREQGQAALSFYSQTKTYAMKFK